LPLFLIPTAKSNSPLFCGLVVVIWFTSVIFCSPLVSYMVADERKMIHGRSNASLYPNGPAYSDWRKKNTSE
jgi:hypothetical protein